ncbi:MAG TPA: hypothetical protein VIA06_21420 [Candidatus Dormibacteraeota bacterium]|nr:hypothetical protein [Candidatus Dormibacteraeota bacterium]
MIFRVADEEVAMPVMMVRYEVPEEGVDEVSSATEAAFAALRSERPEGIRYACYHRRGTGEFLALLELEEGVENPLPAIDAARRLQATVARLALGDAPAPQPLRELGSYGFGG